MAIESTTTPFAAIEDASAGPRFTHSEISATFSQLLQSLAGAIETERDIERACPQHTRFDTCLSHAEAGWERVTELARAVVDGGAERRSDRPLQRAALLLYSVLGCESRDEFDRYASLPQSHPQLFQTTAGGGLGWRVSGMLDSAQHHLSELAGLDMIRGLETLEEQRRVAPEMELRA